jgi:hypothetical protein
MNDSSIPDITVRQAFGIAGHAIPKNAELYTNGEMGVDDFEWMYRVGEKVTTFEHGKEGLQWLHTYEWNGKKGIDLADIPVSKVMHVLPKNIREAALKSSNPPR